MRVLRLLQIGPVLGLGTAPTWLFARRTIAGFCGYSFPDADIHIKYLLNRAQANRKCHSGWTVSNNHPGKREAEIAQEKERYTRFLGADIDYTNKPFHEFSANVLAVIRPLPPGYLT